jgi:serine O-acetyltransferase
MGALKKDLKRYVSPSGKFEWYELSFLYIIIYRFGVYIRKIKFKPLRIILNFVYSPIFIFFSFFMGIYIPRGVKLGGGLKIYHFGGIILNPLSIIGENCTLRQGVTIGNKNYVDDVPIIGNNVEFGAGCVVIGKIKVGNNVTIGANAVVIKDVPDNSIAVGIPAKNYKKNEKQKI